MFLVYEMPTFLNPLLSDLHHRVHIQHSSTSSPSYCQAWYSWTWEPSENY